MNFVELVHARPTERAVQLLLESLEKYFRIEMEGVENLPKTGSAILIPNHSGFAGADAVMLAHMVHKCSGRPARIIAHKGYFEWFKFVRRISESFGLREANMGTALASLSHDNIVVVFPEGESGNFKSSLRRYFLRRFHTGFVRMALKSGAPVLPVTIVGAEETHFNVGFFDFSRFVRNLKFPMPMNLMPLPAKWNIRIGEPLDLSHYCAQDADDPEKMRDLAEGIRLRMQADLDFAVRKRPYIYFPPVSEWADRWKNR